jgi:restriction system protein
MFTSELKIQLLSLMWKFAILLFLMAIGLLFIGFLLSFFTYGRHRKQSKKTDFVSEMLELGEAIGHRLNDRFRGKTVASSGEWMSDTQILSTLKQLKPAEFEQFIARMYTKLGYETKVIGGGSDGGVDIELSKDGRQSVVQCKKFVSQIVRPTDVRDFYGAMGHRHITGKGIFVTTNIFTSEAEQFADGKMELIDGTRLISLVKMSGVELPHGVSIPDSGVCPKCGEGKIVERKNRVTGEKFYGCSRYPKCHFMKSVE